MAIGYTDFSGVGNAFSKLGDIFAQGPKLAVEADLNRARRNELVANTALLGANRDKAVQDLVTAKYLQGNLEAANAMYAGGFDPADPAAKNKMLGLSLGQGGKFFQNPSDIFGNFAISNPSFAGDT